MEAFSAVRKQNLEARFLLLRYDEFRRFFSVRELGFRLGFRTWNWWFILFEIL